MKKLIAIVAVLALIIPLSAGCAIISFKDTVSSIRGTGSLIEREYPCGEFTKLCVAIPSNIYYSAQKSDTVRIEMHENLERYIKVTNKNGELVLEAEAGIELGSSSDSFNVYVSAPTLESIDLRGAVSLKDFDKIDADALKLAIAGAVDGKLRFDVRELSVSASGASDITLEGAAESAVIHTAGVATVNGFGLNAKTATASVAGVGGIDITCIDTLNAEIAGAGAIRYKGDPQLNKTIAGVGMVKKMD